MTSKSVPDTAPITAYGARANRGFFYQKRPRFRRVIFFYAITLSAELSVSLFLRAGQGMPRNIPAIKTYPYKIPR